MDTELLEKTTPASTDRPAKIKIDGPLPPELLRKMHAYWRAANSDNTKSRSAL